jgi:hypothetical protein
MIRLSIIGKSLCLLLVVLSLVLLFSCKRRVSTRNRADEKGLPPVMLWAWERPEDLEFLDPRYFGVAFLAQTLALSGEEVIFNPRRQPLKVSPQTKLIAVTRIESQKTTGKRAALSLVQRDRLLALILKTRELTNVSAIQIDFDAVTSEREFYRALLNDLRRQLPDDVPLSMTALASFCLGDRWLADLPVDEAVPMIFRMGTDDKPIRNLLSSGNDFKEPLCRKSYGIAIDDPVQMKIAEGRRVYVFNSHAWTRNDLASLPAEVRQWHLGAGRVGFGSSVANQFHRWWESLRPEYHRADFLLPESPDLSFADDSFTQAFEESSRTHYPVISWSAKLLVYGE